MNRIAPVQPSARAAIEGAGFADRLSQLKLPKAPPTRVRNLVIWMLIMAAGLFGGLGSWAALAPMTSAVVASGTFRVVGDRLAVQHLEGGMVREINVREGDTVAAGDVIAVLDTTRADAQLGILNSQLTNALAEDMRLRAEHQERDTLEVPAELVALVATDPDLAPLIEAQRDIFASNTEMMAGQVEILHDRIAQFDEQLAGYAQRKQSLQDQLDLVQEELSGLETLFEQGLTTIDRVTRRRQDEAVVMGEMASIDSNILDMHQQVAEIDERILQVRRDRLLQVAADRSRVQATIFDVRQRLDALADVSDRLTIRAPRPGRIVNFEINTVGAVLQPGERLLEIVPNDTDFVVETRVSPSDIDEVRMGGPARVRLSAYSFRSTPPVRGEVTYISADSLVDPDTGMPYFQVDVAVSAADLAALPHIVTLPGMPADVMLETGEQTLVDYIVGPVLGGMETALTEGN